MPALVADEVRELLPSKNHRTIARRAAEVFEVTQCAAKLTEPAVLISPTTCRNALFLLCLPQAYLVIVFYFFVLCWIFNEIWKKNAFAPLRAKPPYEAPPSPNLTESDQTSVHTLVRITWLPESRCRVWIVFMNALLCRVAQDRESLLAHHSGTLSASGDDSRSFLCAATAVHIDRFTAIFTNVSHPSAA